MNSGCGCGDTVQTYSICNSCGSNPCRCQSYECSGSICPIQLDSSCVLYHKFNNAASALTSMGISNGATLEFILSVVDSWIAQLKVQTFDLDGLRETYVVNTLKQFTEAVDVELTALKESITPSGSFTRDYLGELSSDPGAAINGNYWFNTNQNKLKIKTNGLIKEILTA